MRRFAGIELAQEVIPDESTILRFRHLLEVKKLTAAIFAEARTLLEEKRLLLKSGTIVDATIVSAPSSDEERGAGARSGDASGQEAQAVVRRDEGTRGDKQAGLVHSLTSGPAHEADITRLDELLHSEGDELYGDQAYWSEDHRQHCPQAGIRYRVNRRPKAHQPLSA